MITSTMSRGAQKKDAPFRRVLYDLKKYYYFLSAEPPFSSLRQASSTVARVQARFMRQ